MGDLVIVPSAGDGYIQLARHKTGKLFRKHLLNKGPLRRPDTGEIINVDDDFINKMKKNFDDGVCDIVQVPLANAKNEHSEEPDRNIGEVVDLEIDGDKLYAIVDIRDPLHADRMGKTYLGASAMMSLDYINTKTGEKVGPTLLHSCVTNRPYVTGLDSYQEVLAATTTDRSEEAVVLSDVIEKPAEETEMPSDQETTPTVAEPSLEELLTTLKTKHGIDVSALQAQQNAAADQTKLSQTIIDALTNAGVVKLSNTDTDTVPSETVIAAVQELASDNVSLTNRVQAMEKREAEHAVDQLITQGRILPAQRKAMVELKLTNPTMFDQIVPANPIVKLSTEMGVNVPDDKKQELDVDAEVKRLHEAYLK